MTVPWTAGLTLHCSGCGRTRLPGPLWFGCPECGGPLETRYAPGSRSALPIRNEALTDLGRVETPILELEREATWLKLEQRNPTTSHKDRFHAVTSAIARELGATGVVTTSTGNHGVSCAAHAARDDLACIVLSTHDLPPALHTQIAASGALVAMLASDDRRGALVQLVREGWVPATSSDPALSGAANPYGADGYREIVDEITSALGEAPGLIAVPAASGDTLVGIARGAVAQAARTGGSPATVLACQPEGAATIETSLNSGRHVSLSQPRSIARSTADPMTGRLAIEAVARCGRVLTIAETDIIATTRELARRGLYVEASSALALAGIRLARNQGHVGADALCVALITSGGRGWTENESEIVGEPHAIRSIEELLGASRRLSSERPTPGGPLQPSALASGLEHPE